MSGNVIDLPRTGETTSCLVCGNCERIIDGAFCVPCRRIAGVEWGWSNGVEWWSCPCKDGERRHSSSVEHRWCDHCGEERPLGSPLAAANAIGNFLGWCYPYPWPCALCGEDLWELDEYGGFEGFWCGCENTNGGEFWMAYLGTWNRRPSLVPT